MVIYLLGTAAAPGTSFYGSTGSRPDDRPDSESRTLAPAPPGPRGGSPEAVAVREESGPGAPRSPAADPAPAPPPALGECRPAERVRCGAAAARSCPAREAFRTASAPGGDGHPAWRSPGPAALRAGRKLRAGRRGERSQLDGAGTPAAGKCGARFLPLPTGGGAGTLAAPAGRRPAGRRGPLLAAGSSPGRAPGAAARESPRGGNRWGEIRSRAVG